MEVSITYISSDRFYGKAYRANYKEVDRLQSVLASSLNDLLDCKKVEVWIVDQPSDYVEVKV
jgi:hypothetical protein